MKPKVAFFDFAGCEGCQLEALNLTPEELLDLVAPNDDSVTESEVDHGEK